MHAYRKLTKKAAERFCQLHRAGLVCRVPFFPRGAGGRSEFVYYLGRKPARPLLRHTIVQAELRVLSALSFPVGGEFDASFFYGHEVSVTGFRPDFVLVITKDDRSALVFGEADCGTERLASPHAYCLLGKLKEYASYFDAGKYREDFSWAGSFRGFRVALVLLSAGRLANVQRLIKSAGLDFVLLATIDDLKAGLDRPVWRDHEDQLVDILGRSQS